MKRCNGMCLFDLFAIMLIIFACGFFTFVIYDAVQWHKAGKPNNWQGYKQSQIDNEN